MYIWYKCKFLVVLRIKPRASSVLDAHLPLNYGPRVMSTFNLWLVELAEMRPEDRGQTLCKKKVKQLSEDRAVQTPLPASVQLLGDLRSPSAAEHTGQGTFPKIPQQGHDNPENSRSNSRSSCSGSHILPCGTPSHTGEWLLFGPVGKHRPGTGSAVSSCHL